MAAPMETAERRTPTWMSQLGGWAQKAIRAFGLPLGSVLLAFVVGSIVIVITGRDVGLAYQDIVCGTGFFCPESVTSPWLLQTASMIAFATPLIFAGLAVAISFRAGLFNIGVQGQLIMGAIAALVIGTNANLKDLPGFILLPLVLLGGGLGGALWGGLVGVLKAVTGAHEVVTTIMLNFVAIYFLQYLLLGGPLQLPGVPDNSAALPEGAQLPTFFSKTVFLYGQRGDTYPASVGILIALAAALVFGLILRRMALGYEIRAVGQSQRAARYAGVSVRRTIIVSMLLAGAFSGLAGATQIAGPLLQHHLTHNDVVDSTGFDAIAVALLGQNTAVGIVLAALLFATLHVGGSIMQSDAGVSSNLVDILQALILFFLAANFLRTLKLRLPGLGRRPSAAEPAAPEETPAASVPVAALQADEDVLNAIDRNTTA